MLKLFIMKISLQDYNHPLNVTPCKKGFWVSVEFGKFIMNTNGKIRIFTSDEIDQGVINYMNDFPIQYKQDLVKLEAVKNGEPVPMLSIDYNDPEGMNLMKRVFGAEALKNSNGIEDIKINLNKFLNQKTSNLWKTLHLNLKRKWFDMILSGEKKEEYRDLTMFWGSRLTDKICCESIVDVEVGKTWLYDIDIEDVVWKEFDTVTFSNGMVKDAPRFVIEFKGFEIRGGKQEWGAIKGVEYFTIKLGKVVSKINF